MMGRWTLGLSDLNVVRSKLWTPVLNVRFQEGCKEVACSKAKFQEPKYEPSFTTPVAESSELIRLIQSQAKLLAFPPRRYQFSLQPFKSTHDPISGLRKR